MLTKSLISYWKWQYWTAMLLGLGQKWRARYEINPRVVWIICETSRPPISSKSYGLSLNCWVHLRDRFSVCWGLLDVDACMRVGSNWRSVLLGGMGFCKRDSYRLKIVGEWSLKQFVVVRGWCGSDGWLAQHFRTDSLPSLLMSLRTRKNYTRLGRIWMYCTKEKEV